MSIYQILPGPKISHLHLPSKDNGGKVINSEFKSEFSHLLVYDYDKKYKLVVDTFNNVLDLVDKEVLFNLFEKGKVSNIIYKYFLRRFMPPQSEEGKRKLKHSYNKFLKDRKNLYTIVFGICPTYSCNMRCKYCYQKHGGYNNQLISDKNLKYIFDFIKNSPLNKNTPTVIELFGGEPLQKRNKEVIAKVLSFCKQNSYPLTMTTNGLDIYNYLDLFVLYSKYILRVATTLDGVGKFHNLRRGALSGVDGFDRISKGVDFLLNLGIDTDLYMNIDYENLAQLPKLLKYCKDKKWLNNDNFKIRVGRVDDRYFKGLSNTIMSESELLNQIVLLFKDNLEAPKNFELAFLKTILPLAQLFNIDFGQNELVARYHYCSSVSPFIKGHYIDYKLDAYRCPYSVGNKDFSIGNIKKEVDAKKWEKHFLLSLPECLNCPLGGYCSGSCYLSGIIDHQKNCLDEKKNFDNFIKKLIIPKIKGLNSNIK
ncbi:radical SAM protein [Candidatus Shapirobacteria bacterium]|nr:radical SAM protein [Candidatus Shapirobacteria bacterium]